MSALLRPFFTWGETPLKKNSYVVCVLFYFFIYLPYFDLLPLSVALVGPALALISFIPFTVRLRARPHFSGLLMAICALYVYESFGSVLGLLPGVAFLSMLAPLKLYELKNQRDLYLYVLVLILLLVGSIVSVDSFYALIHVIVVIFGLFVLLATYQSESKEFKIKNKKKGVLWAIFLWSLPASLVLFILFPRIQWGNFLFHDDGDLGKTGFMESLQPGTFSSIVRDNSAFFRAEFNSSEVPNLSAMYWRGSVLTQPRGFHWYRRGLSKSFRSTQEATPIYDYRILFEERGGGAIFTLENTFEVRPRARGKLFSDVGNTFRIENYNGKALSYEARTSSPQYQELKERERAHLLSVQSEVGQRMRDFVASFHPQLSGRERVSKFLRYIQSEKFVYSLNPGNYSQDNGLDEFFFDRRIGFCEHYASLLATVARLMDIPSRVVVGFHGGLKNPYGNYYLVRGGDAHAWVELWFEKVGWQRFDPVAWIAPSRIEFGATEYYELLSNYEGGLRRFLLSGSSGLLGQVLLGLDLVFFRLNQSFIAYDVDAQKDFLSSFGLDNLSRTQLVMISFGAFFLLSLPLYLWARLHREGALRSKVLYQRLRQKMALAGIESTDWQGPYELSQIVATSYLPECDVLATHLREFAQLKYSTENDDNALQSKMVSELKKALAVIASSKQKTKILGPTGTS